MMKKYVFENFRAFLSFSTMQTHAFAGQNTQHSTLLHISFSIKAKKRKSLDESAQGAKFHMNKPKCSSKCGLGDLK